ncbi:SDR family NAD(P)-dependent oxidoreductase [Clostridium lacusfryxellense]|uniref:SDR family NAD(P)-dependent oxidoreductase n=1 Tax=Clostridium lacusfryxellense TaxID=205328 RepID=UPI001C0BF162|nr:SDR family oxidoreductase [Clostridium lacusfryxellense]MBU3113188.1 SDR family oxidoreductase [Clostridium lacusfryxellense]
MIGKNLEKIFSLDGKVIVLTGATGGIGSVLAKTLASVGADMALCGTSIKKLLKLEGEIINCDGKAKSFELNIADMESVKECVNRIRQEYGRIDVLINCAGINKREGLLDVEEDTYDKIMDVNLKGLFFLSQEVIKIMIKAKKGNIINMASHNSVGMLGGCSVYGATKSALLGITRSMAVELAQYGIRANAIAPGHILTPLTKITWEHPDRSKFLRQRTAMGRPGIPEELVGLTIMLASDSSSFMSGMVYHVDGGYLAGGSPWNYDTQY